MVTLTTALVDILISFTFEVEHVALGGSYRLLIIAQSSWYNKPEDLELTRTLIAFVLESRLVEYSLKRAAFGLIPRLFHLQLLLGTKLGILNDMMVV